MLRLRSLRAGGIPKEAALLLRDSPDTLAKQALVFWVLALRVPSEAEP
jgi:hypothetical protein